MPVVKARLFYLSPFGVIHPTHSLGFAMIHEGLTSSWAALQAENRQVEHLFAVCWLTLEPSQNVCLLIGDRVLTRAVGHC